MGKSDQPSGSENLENVDSTQENSNDEGKSDLGEFKWYIAKTMTGQENKSEFNRLFGFRQAWSNTATSLVSLALSYALLKSGRRHSGYGGG